jgi:hypothetical protein
VALIKPDTNCPVVATTTTLETPPILVVALPLTSEIFTLLFENKIIPSELADYLKKSVGFRNLAVHEYSKLDLEKVYSLSKNELNIFLEFGKVIFTLYET